MYLLIICRLVEKKSHHVSYLYLLISSLPLRVLSTHEFNLSKCKKARVIQEIFYLDVVKRVVDEELALQSETHDFWRLKLAIEWRP